MQLSSLTVLCEPDLCGKPLAYLLPVAFFLACCVLQCACRVFHLSCFVLREIPSTYHSNFLIEVETSQGKTSSVLPLLHTLILLLGTLSTPLLQPLNIFTGHCN